MARLRTLAISTVDGLRDILILDKLDDPDQANGSATPEDLREAGIPPILAFSYEVDLPQIDNDGETIDISGVNSP